MVTGKTLNVDESTTTYDADNDGQLSKDEMDRYDANNGAAYCLRGWYAASIGLVSE